MYLGKVQSPEYTEKETLYLPMSGNGSTISQFGTDLKNMATFCIAISVAWEIISPLVRKLHTTFNKITQIKEWQNSKFLSMAYTTNSNKPTENKFSFHFKCQRSNFSILGMKLDPGSL